MNCWSCQKVVEGGGVRCACGALLPGARGASPFELLGFPARFTLGEAEIERRFRELSWQLHPDRFAKSDPRERRIALERSTALNDARRALRDEARRAEALLLLHGRTPAGERAEKLPLDFLEEVLTLREELSEAQASNDAPAVGRLVARVRGQREEALRTLARTLDGEPSPGALDLAQEALAKLRYCDRFVAEAAGPKDPDEPNEVRP
ncbi:MAG: Fe-S protein assembly co-chaperone HscB [Deltaproteobacteria bacterium]